MRGEGDQEREGHQGELTIFLGWRRSLGNKLLRSRRHVLTGELLHPPAIMYPVSKVSEVLEVGKRNRISRDPKQDHSLNLR